MNTARNAMTLTGGLTGAYAVVFARTLVLATLVPVADYGRAAALAIMLSVVEMLVTTGTQVRVVQHKSGDTPDFLDAMHGFQLARGLLGAGVIAALAWPMATLLAMPELVWGFATLAILPPISGLCHLDQFRLTRSAHYTPQALTAVIPAIVSLAAIWPLAAWLGDWRAFVGAVAIQYATTLVLSHLVAEQRWRPRIRPFLRDNIRFIAPLMATGVLLVVAMQGDRVAVGRYLSEEVLAVFAIAATLTVAPCMIAIRVLAGLLQPPLARTEGEGFAKSTHHAYDIHAIVACAIVSGGALCAGLVVATLFPPAMSAAAALIPPLAAIQAIRLLRAGTGMALLARADGLSDLMGNFPRIAAVTAGATALAFGAPLSTIFILAALGEVVGLALTMRRLAPLAPMQPMIRTTVPLIPLLLVCLWPNAPHALVVTLAIATPLALIAMGPNLRAVASGHRLFTRRVPTPAKPL